MTANQLASETSPYLLQHKDNPVHWRVWGPEALAEAARDNKPLLVSIGYAACHWCHVMAHESFEDPETAALMNDLYVCVKVDREERPDIDNWLQTTLAAANQGGGWPLTAFLTPQGKPFWAGTYYPKEDSFERPGFKTVLREVAARIKDDPDSVEQNARQIADVMERAWSQNRSGAIDALLLEHLSIATAQRFDIFFGGITGAPKFPSVPTVKLLWRAYLRTGAMQFLQVVLTTVDSICRGGIYDQVGGGFFRYATDERWLIPHFEKMLLDNAQMLDILVLLWQHNRNPLYRRCIDDTVGWLLREMRVEDAAFASSLDADTEGEEGKYYTWTEAEIDSALQGTMAARFKQAYGVSAQGNFNGRNVLHRYIALSDLTQADEDLFKTQRARLLQARHKRVQPFRDTKVLADWNGAAIAAIANAGAVLQQRTWTDAARKAFAFVVEKLGDGDTLHHSYCNGKRGNPAFSDDYAQMARAALILHDVTGEADYLERAKAWTRVLDAQYWEPNLGGYALSIPSAAPDQVRIRTAFDSQNPSANGIMLEVVGRLFYLTGEQPYSERVNALVTAFSGDVTQSYMQMPTFLNGFEFCALALQVVIIGEPKDARTIDLANAVLGRSLPNRILTVIAPDQSLPAGHPAYGKTMQNNQPTAYVCQGQVCSSPVISAVNLSQALQLPQANQTAVQQAATGNA